jgi:hypothetical protein
LQPTGKSDILPTWKEGGFMKDYWLIFSNGFMMRSTVDVAKKYCEWNKCTFKILCPATKTEWEAA